MFRNFIDLYARRMMKRWMIAAALLCLVRTGLAQTTAQSDVRTFELVPVAPTTPVLKHRLLFGYTDRIPGNAAVQYMTATELLDDAFIKKIEDASDAYDRKGSDFESLAAAMDRPSIFSLLEIGGRCEECDWQAPIREQGVNTLLPYLGEARHMALMLQFHAVLDARQGNIEDAIRSIRVGYELCRNVGHSPILISGLVGVAMARMMNDALAEVMNRPESPNLYWAVASLPRPLLNLSQNIEAEGASFAKGSMPELAGKNLDEVSAADWRSIFRKFAEISNIPAGPPQPWNDATVPQDILSRDLPKAQEDYAQRYGVSAEQVGQLDPFKVVCTFWYQQYLNRADEQQAMASLPYPVAIIQMKDATGRFRRMWQDESLNPILQWASSFDRAVVTYARGDRMRAALADVEAIRSYAAAHDGALPDHLADIMDTPALDNPMTGRPFDYAVDGENATLWDSQAGDSLSYTIRIRK
jgi:hypothetical protein